MSKALSTIEKASCNLNHPIFYPSKTYCLLCIFFSWLIVLLFLSLSWTNLWMYFRLWFWIFFRKKISKKMLTATWYDFKLASVCWIQLWGFTGLDIVYMGVAMQGIKNGQYLYCLCFLSFCASLESAIGKFTRNIWALACCASSSWFEWCDSICKFTNLRFLKKTKAWTDVFFIHFVP